MTLLLLLQNSTFVGTIVPADGSTLGYVTVTGTGASLVNVYGTINASAIVIGSGQTIVPAVGNVNGNSSALASAILGVKLSSTIPDVIDPNLIYATDHPQLIDQIKNLVVNINTGFTETNIIASGPFADSSTALAAGLPVGSVFYTPSGTIGIVLPNTTKSALLRQSGGYELRQSGGHITL
jgi:hypothetical protein